jgi:FkbM family methyltransferase
VKTHPSSPPRWRRILQKLHLRASVAARVLWSLEDFYPRSRIKLSFAQDGEDLIAWRLLYTLGLNRPRYLDIGAHHPEHLSNTALFYLFGGSGINIEPDPKLYTAFLRHRPRDLNLNVGIGPSADTMSFYRMADPSLNTFSPDEAARLSHEQNVAIVEVLPVRVRPIQDILNENRFIPDFMTLDVEGLEMSILRSYDWQHHRPGVICVETVGYSSTGSSLRDSAPGEWLQGLGYIPVAQTLANSLFVDWKYRRLI